MAKLQAVVLFLKCVSSSSIVFVHLDSQTAIDACLAELSSARLVLKEWCEKAYGAFNDRKKVDAQVVNFVRFVVELHHMKA
ncbi:hypothetical protein G9A89_023847 [Geosiphon pyriformis]|nr:hypothetical protein G9A89_023847 [Geosiphon pyriformis]